MKDILCVNFDEFSNMVCSHRMVGQIVNEEDRDGTFCCAKDCMKNEPDDEPWPECCRENCPLWRKWRVSS